MIEKKRKLIEYFRSGNFNIIINNDLSERFFGELDAQPLITYNKVWPIDKVSFMMLLSFA